MKTAPDKTVLQSCGFNCGSRCQLRLHAEDGQVAWVESDTGPDAPDAPQMRACLCGRAWGHWVNSPHRLDYPLKRVGPRGSGQFQRISWDEALDEIAAQIKRITADFGPEAIFFPYASGILASGQSPLERAIDCYGGHLRLHSDYSSAQLQAGTMALFGDDGYYSGSPLEEAANSDVLVLFGSSMFATRQGGAAGGHYLNQLREQAAAEGRPFKVVSIDPRHTPEVRGAQDQWIPLRPGTDAAFVAAVIHELLIDGLADEELLRSHCVGFFEDTLPPGTPPHSSYSDYVLGRGPDGTEKTCAWAAAITGCPAATIRQFARTLAQAKSAFITQGWGPQRSEYGEQTSRAICLLAVASGHFGRPGTNSGVHEPMRPYTPSLPGGRENPVRAALPAFLWTECLQGGGITQAQGLRGAQQLPFPIKMIVNHGGNCLTNQHAAINATHDLLADESRCEFIVVCDVMLNDSARYGDIVLPELALGERENAVLSGFGDRVSCLRHGESWSHFTGERRDPWSIGRALAERLGVLEAFEEGAGDGDETLAARMASEGQVFAASSADSAGHTGEDDNGKAAASAGRADEDARRLPAPGHEMRALRAPLPCAYGAFRANPTAHPLPTPSGKIEVYSEALARMAQTAQLPDGQVISPIPAYLPAAEGPGSPTAERFPLQLITYHGYQSIHSNFSHLAIVESVMPHALQVNPVDGAANALVEGQPVVVENDRGALVARVHLTPCIMPGVVALPNGAWHNADMAGSRLDWGGCANTLTSLRPSPIARGNGQNSCLVRLRPLTAEEQAAGRERGYDC